MTAGFTVPFAGGIDSEAHPYPYLAVRGPIVGEWEDGEVEGTSRR